MLKNCFVEGTFSRYDPLRCGEEQLPPAGFRSFHFEGAGAAIRGQGFYKILSASGRMDELKLAVHDCILLFDLSAKPIGVIHTAVKLFSAKLAAKVKQNTLQENSKSTKESYENAIDDARMHAHTFADLFAPGIAINSCFWVAKIYFIANVH